MDPNAVNYQQQQAPPPHVSSKGIWVTKLIFRIFAAIFAIILIGVAAGLATFDGDTLSDDSDYYYGYDYYYYWAAGPLAVLIPPAAISLIWSVAEAICLITRGGHRGIHPGAIIAIDLLLWLAFTGCTVSFGLLLWIGNSGYYYDGTGGSSGQTVSALGAAAIAFGSLLIILHITFFIFGCYEASVRNRNQPTIVVYGGGPPHPHQSMYGQPPMAYGQPPMAYGQPIMLPAGQPPPVGYVPYPFPPQQQQDQFPKANEQAQQQQQQQQQPPVSTSPPPQEPSPVHTTSTRPTNDWHNSYQGPQNGQSSTQHQNIQQQ